MSSGGINLSSPSDRPEVGRRRTSGQMGADKRFLGDAGGVAAGGPLSGRSHPGACRLLGPPVQIYKSIYSQAH